MGSHYDSVFRFIQCEFELALYFKASECLYNQQYFKEPISTELLPPPLPPPHGKPYTLLLSIDDLLVTSTWDVRRLCLFPQPCFTHRDHSANTGGGLLKDQA